MSAAVASVVELRARDVVSYAPKPVGTPTAQQFAAFEVVFDHFNSELFGATLPPVMLAFAKKPKSIGYYRHNAWRRPGEEAGSVSEIALCPDGLTREERAVASTIVHEMVHHWQCVEGKPSRRGYHNAEWANRMEALGLMPSNTGEPDGRRTGQRMTHYVIAKGAFERAFEKLDRTVLLPFIAGSPSPTSKPAPTTTDPSKTKFTCPCCGDIARGKPTLMIACRKCETPFVLDGASPSRDADD
jgi:hypothetical protein